MQRFWDRRAAEDAFFFVDNRMPYKAPDLDRFWASGERDLDTLLTALGARVSEDDTVLEIGCGVGRLTRVLAARVASVVALDVSPRMLKLARSYNPTLSNVDWILGDGTSLAGIETASVDACVSHVVFQHIPDPAITLAYVREMGRALRVGGWGAFQISNDPNVHHGATGIERLRFAIRATVGLEPKGRANRHWRGSMVELHELRHAAAQGSLEVERIVGEGTQFCGVLVRHK